MLTVVAVSSVTIAVSRCTVLTTSSKRKKAIQHHYGRYVGRRNSRPRRIQEQIRSLERIKEMAASYGYDISEPAKDVKEAMQWIYFGYLGAIKEAKRCCYVHWS